MKRQIPFLLLLALLAASCGRKVPVQSRCTVRLHSIYPEYSVGELRGLGHELLDSTLRLVNDTLSFVRTDSTRMPYMAFIRLHNPQDRADWIEMPVAIEGGVVEVDLGRYIETKGTPLNEQVQEFLNARQTVNESLDTKKNPGLTVEDIRSAYSRFYREQILSNADNVLGDFIYKAYSVHLQDEDRSAVESKMGNKNN